MIFKKPIIIIAIAVVLLLIIGVFAGVLPFSFVDLDTKTYNANQGGIYGVGELLDQKGYILSWNTNDFSQTITVHGRFNSQIGSMGEMTKYRYLIYLKKDLYSDWELVSQPGNEGTSMYLNSNNPDEKTISGFKGQEYSCYAWNFNILGPDYAGGGIRAVLQGWIDETKLDWEGPRWEKLQSDEAYLYGGTCGLYFPRGVDEEDLDLPYSTFEVGQTVKIGVETGVGGSSDKPWRVTLNKPYYGTIEEGEEDDPYVGGKQAVIEEQVFPNDCDPSNTFFTFTVTAEMAELSMTSSHPYTVRIWNNVLPKGTLQADFVDFLYKSPDIVTWGGDSGKFEVGSSVNVEVSAEVNSETQAGIDYFRISVVYGESNTLLPSDWSSKRWIVHTSNIGGDDGVACNIPQIVSFKADKPGYVTVHAKAFDIQGRASPHTTYLQMFAWDGSEPPDDAVDTGDGYYGGGHSEDWWPWDPSEGNWQLTDDDGSASTLLKIIIIIIIFAIVGIIAYFFPLPGGIHGKIFVIVLGIVLAVLIWIFL